MEHRDFDVELKIYDVEGKLVKTLVNGTRPTGRHEVRWNGQNNSGRSMSSGVYFYRIKVGKTSLTRRMVLLK